MRFRRRKLIPAYTVERPSEPGETGMVVIEDVKETPVEAMLECDRRARAEGRAYSMHLIQIPQGRSSPTRAT